jgi:hypothetical protein
MPVSPSFKRPRFWHRAFVASWVVFILLVGVAAPVRASVPPGTSVTASSTDLKLNIEVDGLADTITCGQFTSTFVLTSKESTKATIPPPTVDDCTDALEPDERYASIDFTTNDKNGNWKLEAPTFGSGGCKKDCVLGLRIPREGASFSSAVLSSCKGILAPSGSLLLTGKYDPSVGSLKFVNELVPIKGRGCTFESPASLSVTITFNPNLGPVPPFAS